MSDAQHKTLVDLIQYRAATSPDKLAYAFLEPELRTQLTYAELDRRARAVAAALQARVECGSRI
ncbi:MAG: hypothetical protein AAGC55_32180, partial [Myxococcota bacterium]